MSYYKNKLGDEIFQRYVYFIDIIIDFVIDVSKQEIKLELNIIKKNVSLAIPIEFNSIKYGFRTTARLDQPVYNSQTIGRNKET